MHRDVLTASGSATVDFAGEVLLPEARIRVENVALAGAVPAYVQPFLIDTAMKDLEGAGSASGEIEIAGGSADAREFHARGHRARLALGIDFGCRIARPAQLVLG